MKERTPWKGGLYEHRPQILLDVAGGARICFRSRRGKCKRNWRSLVAGTETSQPRYKSQTSRQYRLAKHRWTLTTQTTQNIICTKTKNTCSWYSQTEQASRTQAPKNTKPDSDRRKSAVETLCWNQLHPHPSPWLLQPECPRSLTLFYSLLSLCDRKRAVVDGTVVWGGTNATKMPYGFLTVIFL